MESGRPRPDRAAVVGAADRVKTKRHAHHPHPEVPRHARQLAQKVLHRRSEGGSVETTGTVGIEEILQERGDRSFER